MILVNTYCNINGNNLVVGIVTNIVYCNVLSYIQVLFSYNNMLSAALIFVVLLNLHPTSNIRSTLWNDKQQQL